MGAILAFLSSKVLGQYDPFVGMLRRDVPAGGRLVLVAPNIVAIERELKVDPDDFRLWVALHEQTHRVQFAAAPWLREHLRSKISQLLESLLAEPDALGERIKAAAGSLIGGTRNRRPGRSRRRKKGPPSDCSPSCRAANKRKSCPTSQP